MVCCCTPSIMSVVPLPQCGACSTPSCYIGNNMSIQVTKKQKSCFQCIACMLCYIVWLNSCSGCIWSWIEYGTPKDCSLGIVMLLFEAWLYGVFLNPGNNYDAISLGRPPACMVLIIWNFKLDFCKSVAKVYITAGMPCWAIIIIIIIIILVTTHASRLTEQSRKIFLTY